MCCGNSAALYGNFFWGGFDFVTGGWRLGGARGYVALGWGGMVEGFEFRRGGDDTGILISVGCVSGLEGIGMDGAEVRLS